MNTIITMARFPWLEALCSKQRPTINSSGRALIYSCDCLWRRGRYRISMTFIALANNIYCAPLPIPHEFL